MSEETKTPDETRCAIMRHAIDLFSHYGYGKTNIGDIAKAVSMSPGNLYRYFRNKQAIGEAVVEDWMEAEQHAIAAAILNPDLDWRGRVERIVLFSIDNLIRQFRQTPKMVELSDMICEGNSGILLQHLEWKRVMIQAQLNDGVRDGALKLTHDATYDAAGTVLDAVRAFLMPKALEQTDLDSAPQRVNAILGFLLDGMKK